MAPHYVHPLDPDCMVVKEYTTSLLEDPMTEASGAPVDEILEGFAKRHRLLCERCQRYGAANVYVAD